MASSIICIVHLCDVFKVRIHPNGIGNNDFVWGKRQTSKYDENLFFSSFILCVCVCVCKRIKELLLCNRLLYTYTRPYMRTHTHTVYAYYVHAQRTFVTGTPTGTAKTTISQLDTTSPTRTACIRLISKFTMVFCDLYMQNGSNGTRQKSG